MHSMLYATTASEKEAVALVRHLLDKRLIACANIFRIRSLYRWKGKVADEGEYALVMKTRTTHVRKAISEVAKLHSYQVPCIVSYHMGAALPAYLEWIDDETSAAKK